MNFHQIRWSYHHLNYHQFWQIPPKITILGEKKVNKSSHWPSPNTDKFPQKSYYQSKPVISSLNFDRNCKKTTTVVSLYYNFIQPVGRASSLSCSIKVTKFAASMTGARQGWGSSHGLDEIEDCSETCRLTYLEEEHPLVFLITFLLLLLSVPLVFGNHLHMEPSQQWGRGWEGEELSKCDIWHRQPALTSKYGPDRLRSRPIPDNLSHILSPNTRLISSP